MSTKAEQYRQKQGIEQEKENERLRGMLLGTIDSAYDLASGGMGIHLHAVSALGAGMILSESATESLASNKSNFLVNPYVFAFKDPKKINHRFDLNALNLGVVSPHSEAHIKLLHGTEDLYQQIGRDQLRLLLGGQESLDGEQSGSEMTREEFDALLAKAEEKQLVTFDRPIADIEFESTANGLLVNFMRKRIKFSDQLFDDLDKMQLSERFKPRVLRAATHKLGSMMAVTQQLTFDAMSNNSAYPANYLPERVDERWKQNWQRIFGRPMPILEILYQQAHEVFVANSAPADPLTAHIHQIPTLPHLS